MNNNGKQISKLKNLHLLKNEYQKNEQRTLTGNL